jgi:hypothetical protein
MDKGAGGHSLHLQEPSYQHRGRRIRRASQTLPELNWKKTKIRVKHKKTLKNGVYQIVYRLLITPDLLKMLMEKSRV